MAVTAVIGSPAVAVNYTFMTDTSADFASVANSTYFYNKADKLVRYKDGTGTILELFSASGGASGLYGISNGTGVYTYYTTLTLAMAAATSGQVIEMFGDVVETGAVTIDLKDGVSINGNGHSYKSSYATTNIYMFTILTTATFTISNMRIERTAGVYPVLSHFTSGTLYLNNTFIVSNQSGAEVIYCQGSGTIDGGIILNTSATGSGVSMINSAKFLNMKSIVSGSGNGYATGDYTGYFFNCYGQSNSGFGLYSVTSTMVSCIGVSTSGAGIKQLAAQAVTRNCNGLSTTGSGMYLSGSAYNSAGTSVSGIGIESVGGVEMVNCIGVSSSGVGLQQYYGGVALINVTAISSTSSAVYTDQSYAEPRLRIENCYFWTKWDNASGHVHYIGPATFPAVVSGTTLRCTNASAKNLFSSSTVSFKIFKNIYIGGAGNSVGITNSIIDTQDNQGNIYT
jgi:hypothetical protein